MRMKQIIAKDMKEAMLLARETLGEDAVLLSSQKQSGSKSIVVTFAIEDEVFDENFSASLDPHSNDNTKQPVLAANPDAKPTKPAASAPVESSLSVPRSSYPAYELLLSIMAQHRLPEALFIQLTALLDRLDLPEQLSYKTCEQMLKELLSPHVSLAPLDITAGIPEKALMFVGPHGSGKTSLVAKYATAAHIAGIPLTIFSTDTHSMAGTAMLEGLKPLLGCEVMVVETRTQLRNLIKSQAGKQLMLVDSPGVNIYDFQEMKALGEFASLSDVEPILTTAAGMDSDEALELAGVFSFLNIKRFAVTRCDSTRHLASLYAILNEGYALASISASPKISTPPSPASHALLAQHMCAHIRERMA